MSKRILYILPVLLLVAMAFFVGFVAQDVSASHGDPRELIASIRLLPSRMELLSGVPEKPQAELPVLETYHSVLDRLQSEYYGGKVNDREMTYDAIRGMLASLNDPYTRFLDPTSYKQMREENEGNFVGIGAQLDVNTKQQVYIKEPLPDSPAILAGVKAGDIILRVDNKPIAGLDIDQVVKKIRGAEGTKVRLTLLRAPKQTPVEIYIVRRVVEFRMVRSKMLDKTNKIGYVRLYGFNEHSDGQMDDALTELDRQKMKGLILDLRQNPGGLLPVAIDIGSRFVESGPIVIIQERDGRRDPLNVDDSKHNHKKPPLVVLVDRSSASASEIVSGAIQDNKTGTLVGTRTFGKARVQTVTALVDGSAIAITTAKYLTPKGRDINKVGVQPDVQADSPKTAVEFGDPKVDTQLVKAMNVLKGKMGLPSSQPAVASGGSR